MNEHAENEPFLAPANKNSVQPTKQNPISLFDFGSNSFAPFLDTLTQQYLAKRDDTRLLPPELAERIEKIRARIPEKARQKMMQPLIVPGTPLYGLLKERYNEQQQLKLMKYMARVQDRAAQKMLDDPDFAKDFIEKDEFNAVVLSLDIRRSTELMLKAKTPQQYAEFVNTLTNELTESVKERFGIYDKFTGDGLLAFFPDFYSGPDALLHALLCADDCQRIFEAIFPSYRHIFDISDDMVTGIGIGIDTGSVYKAGIEMEYTVVGKPVVYACRLSGAPAGHTYLTPAAEMIRRNSNGAQAFFAKKTEIDIKHEGLQPAYDVIPVTSHAIETLEVAEPDWCK
jgi:class 3 adenylate cyclase